MLTQFKTDLKNGLGDTLVSSLESQKLDLSSGVLSTQPVKIG